MNVLWRAFQDKIRGIPWILLINVYALIGVGLFNLYSATGADVSFDRFNDQIRWIVLGSFAMIFWGVILDIRSIERLTILGYLAVCGLLLAVDIFGKTSKGAERWLVIGPARIQPSEFAKFIIILITAKSFLYMKGIQQFSLLNLWRQALFVGLPFMLILFQPDLGTAGLVVLIASLQLLLIRIDWRSILAVGVSGLTAAWLAWSFVLYDYQKQRVLNFLNPMRDPRGAGYHSIQSMIAVGSGGVWGRGFQQGSQSQLNFLPERHTDFIFSVWAEEHGFIGCMVVFALFASLILLTCQVAERAKDTFSSLVAVGVTAFLLFHFVINVSMVVGMFPVVGVPLSLISYGGSHMLTVMSCIGLLIAVERRRLAQQI